MPYTNENTSNTRIEDRNTIKSRTYLHCGPQHKTSRQDKTLRECVIINKKKNLYFKYLYFLAGTYRNETCIEPLDPYRKMSV